MTWLIIARLFNQVISLLSYLEGLPLEIIANIPLATTATRGSQGSGAPRIAIQSPPGPWCCFFLYQDVTPSHVGKYYNNTTTNNNNKQQQQLLLLLLLEQQQLLQQQQQQLLQQQQQQLLLLLVAPWSIWVCKTYVSEENS